jgi:hypothetical protein
MLPYWLLYFALAFGALIYSPRANPAGEGHAPIRPKLSESPMLLAVALIIILMIGLRFEVGADWRAYLLNYKPLANLPFDDAIRTSPQEYGYTALSWMIAQAGFGIWLVNLVCAIPFVVGLVALARQQQNPYLALTVAAPLLIITVAMGFTRQATGLGFLLIGLTSLLNGKPYWHLLVWTVIGSLFHLSVLIFIPIVALLIFRGRLGSVLLLILTGAIGYFVVLPEALQRYSSGYLRTTYEAPGAIFRLGINALAALIVLLLARRFFSSRIEARIWTGWAALALLSLVILYFVRSTVVVDRLAVYILPLQVFAFARLPQALGGHRASKPWTILVIFLYALVLFTWLTFANHARLWIPYRVYPFFP